MIAALLAAAAVALPPACDVEHPSGKDGCTRAAVDRLKMNQLQTMGTHNSYKIAIAPLEMANVRAANPKAAQTLDYSHEPLTDQLNDGARQLELDFVYDPKGGRYSTPLGRKMAPNTTPYDLSPMSRPGMKVMHVPDIDYRSVCPLLVDCFKEVRAWSNAHPDHVPILIIFNLKQDNLKIPGAVTLLPFDAAAMDAVDAEIRSVFKPGEIITPDSVQGKHRTLREAVLAGAWPTLKQARGKIMLAMDESPGVVAVYRGARKSLEGRMMFVNIDENSPAAGYITLNEPIKEHARIQAAVKAGLIVRTRADADTWEARKNDTAPRDAAFSSGANYVSTDYRHPDPRFSPYEARLPDGLVARENPVDARP
jgi:calcium-dependent phosphoinositide phospholipase C